MKDAFTLFTLTLLLFLPFLVLNQTVQAQQLVCPESAIDQITNDDDEDSSDPSINADGTRIAFHSDGDIDGDNPDNNLEIYLFDTTAGMITQITNETGDSFAPSINADGTRIAFASTANITGGNLDGSQEVYLFDMSTGMFTQITNETGDSFALQ